MIYTLTFNPALDYVLKADKLTFGATNRSSDEEITFGGKGINVSFILNELGIKNTALGFVAGFTGAELEKRLGATGIITDFIHLEKGMTRINVKLKGEEITEINAAGPKIDNNALEKLFTKLNNIKNGDTLILAGSIPKSLPDDIYQKILEALKNKGIRFVVDAEGELLVNALKYKPFLIKPNVDELSHIAGKKLQNDDEIIQASKELQKRGALNVLVSRGKDGAILLGENGEIIKKTALKIKAVNTVGCGDSMVAGFLAGINNGFNYALNLATAAAAATAETDMLGKKESILKLLS